MDNGTADENIANTSEGSTETESKKVIFIIDDDALLRNMYKQKLTTEGYKVISASDGEEALSIFKKESVDLILTDIMMPRISGTELIEDLRKTKKGKNIPIIAWSNLNDETVKERALKLGAVEYLAKGALSLDQVVATVKKYLP